MQIVNENFLQMEGVNKVRGIFALLVVIQHCTLGLVAVSTALVNDIEVTFLFVSIFFFVSGYGLTEAMKTRPNYFETFLRRRFSKILTPMLTFLIITTVIITVLLLIRIIPMLTMLEITTVLGPLWFVVELVPLYAAFFLVFRKVKASKGVWLMFPVTLLIMAALWIFFFFVTGPFNEYLKAAIAFPLGIAMSYFPAAMEFIKTNYAKIQLAAPLILFALIYVFWKVDAGPIVTTITCAVMTILFTAAFFSFMYRIDAKTIVILILQIALIPLYLFLLPDLPFQPIMNYGLIIAACLLVSTACSWSKLNMLWGFLGILSYEIYIAHGLVVMALVFNVYVNGILSTVGDSILLAAVCLLLTIPLALLIRTADKKLFGRISKPSKAASSR